MISQRLYVLPNYVKTRITILPTSTLSFARLIHSSEMSEPGPIETSIRNKLTEAFSPTFLEIFNESRQHSNHAAMQGVESKETHFRVAIISSAFAGQTHIQRHRSVYALLNDEMQNRGVHALSIRAKTPEEAVETADI